MTVACWYRACAQGQFHRALVAVEPRWAICITNAGIECDSICISLPPPSLPPPLAHTRARAHTHICVHAYVHAYVHVRARAFSLSLSLPLSLSRARAHTHTHTHKHTHTQTHTTMQEKKVIADIKKAAKDQQMAVVKVSYTSQSPHAGGSACPRRRPPARLLLLLPYAELF